MSDPYRDYLENIYQQGSSTSYPTTRQGYNDAISRETAFRTAASSHTSRAVSSRGVALGSSHRDAGACVGYGIPSRGEAEEFRARTARFSAQCRAVVRSRREAESCSGVLAGYGTSSGVTATGRYGAPTRIGSPTRRSATTPTQRSGGLFANVVDL